MRFHSVVPDGHHIGAPGTVFVDTIRYSKAAGAAVVVADARRVVGACRSYTSQTEASTDLHPAHGVHTWTVLGEGFAGDDSLLVRQQFVSIDDSTGRQVGDSIVDIYAIVHVADLVTVVESYTTDPGLLRDLGAKAATRLCVAAIPRC
jgi:hypothetical protein